MPAINLEAILRTLAHHGVDFIVVGGVASVIEGAPINTFDLDIVHSREPRNIDCLIAALESLEASYRTHPERKLKPDRSITKWGPLDVLGTIGQSRGYADLLPHASAIEVGENLRVLVLNLETQIAVKEEVGGEKDLAMLPVLRRTLDEKRRR